MPKPDHESSVAKPAGSILAYKEIKTHSMQFLLAKFATLAVMLHMACGCVWHHGLVGSHPCIKDVFGDSCCDHQLEIHDHVDGACHAHQPFAELSLPEPSVNCDDLNCAPHFCCQDDRCQYFQVVDFDCDALSESAEYLDGILNVSVKTASDFPVDQWQLPDFCQRLAPPLRAHLYLCVQLL